MTNLCAPSAITYIYFQGIYDCKNGLIENIKQGAVDISRLIYALQFAAKPTQNPRLRKLLQGA